MNLKKWALSQAFGKVKGAKYLALFDAIESRDISGVREALAALGVKL
jgi:hypothetical protein